MQVSTTPSQNNAPFMSAEEASRVKEEADRRVLASATGGSSTLHDGGECNIPFKQESQLYALVNMSNIGQRPVSENPAIRILGLFPTAEEVSEHITFLHETDFRTKLCNMYMITTHGFYSIPENYDFKMNEQLERVNKNLLVYHRQLDEITKEFTEHHDDLTNGLRPVVMEEGNDGTDTRKQAHTAQQRINKNKQRVAELEKDGEGAEEEKNEPTPDETKIISQTNSIKLPRTYEHKLPVVENGKTVNNISRNCEIRGQKYVSLMILRDFNGNDREPAVSILGAFDTEEECISYNKYVAAKNIEKFDLYTKSMYEWIYPNMAFSKDIEQVDQLYRNEELDRIMRAHRANTGKVEQFESYFNENNMDIPEINIEPDLDAPQVPRLKAPTGSNLE